jgi:phosphoglycerate dehydrogenase-like enzyme
VPEIAVALVTVRWSDAYLTKLKEQLQPAEIIHTQDAAEIASALARADVAILSGDLDDRFADAPHLRWIHCDHAGLNT